MAGEDKASKKHPASQQKLKRLKKKGQVAKSTDVPMAAGLLAAFGAMFAMRNFYLNHFNAVMEYCLSSIADAKTNEGIDYMNLCLFAMKETLLLSAPVLSAVLLVAVLSNLAMTGIIITGEQMKPNFNKLNPMTKMKQWFSIKSLQELGKSLAKIVVASYIGYSVWKGAMTKISESVFLDPHALLSLGGQIIFQLFWKIMILYLVVAIIDYMMQKKNFLTEQKMTDKEVRDEYKNSEGDPYMKGKRRQMAMQIAMQQSQEQVPHSDVVVVNPTELAIAIKYDPDVSPVPYVVSKGEKRHADDIRESAKKHGVPVVRNKPLARALFEMCEIGDLVPEDLYRPVAEVLAYVFGLQEASQSAAATPSEDGATEGALVGAAPAVSTQTAPVSAANAGMPATAWGSSTGGAAPFTWSPVAREGGDPAYTDDFADYPVYTNGNPSYSGGAAAHPTGARLTQQAEEFPTNG